VLARLADFLISHPRVFNVGAIEPLRERKQGLVAATANFGNDIADSGTEIPACPGGRALQQGLPFRSGGVGPA